MMTLKLVDHFCQCISCLQHLQCDDFNIMHSERKRDKAQIVLAQHHINNKLLISLI